MTAFGNGGNGWEGGLGFHGFPLRGRKGISGYLEWGPVAVNELI